MYGIKIKIRINKWEFPTQKERDAVYGKISTLLDGLIDKLELTGDDCLSIEKVESQEVIEVKTITTEKYGETNE